MLGPRSIQGDIKWLFCADDKLIVLRGQSTARGGPAVFSILLHGRALSKPSVDRRSDLMKKSIIHNRDITLKSPDL